MKSNSDVRPPVMQDLGDGSRYYNYNIREAPVSEESERTSFEYDAVLFHGEPDYGKIVSAIVAERYGQAEETALTNKGIADKNNPEYAAYREWVTEVKGIVKGDLFP
jgi:hypothetical protein